MEHYDIIRFGLILAVQAEIEGMKAQNIERASNDLALAYSEEDFIAKAEEIRNITYCHGEQL